MKRLANPTEVNLNIRQALLEYFSDETAPWDAAVICLARRVPDGFTLSFSTSAALSPEEHQAWTEAVLQSVIASAKEAFAEFSV